MIDLQRIDERAVRRKLVRLRVDLNFADDGNPLPIRFVVLS